MTEVAAPILIHDPGIEDQDLLEDLLATIGKGLDKARSITQGRLLVGSDEVYLGSILFDTGALHRSYVSKELVDRHRSGWDSSLVPVESLVRLADQKTVLGSKEELKAYVTIPGEGDREFTAELDLVVWSMPGMDMIVGLPDITTHFRDKMIQMKTNLEDITTDMEPGALLH